MNFNAREALDPLPPLFLLTGGMYFKPTRYVHV